jgi:formate dehydrogenase maturation protein FdhE
MNRYWFTTCPNCNRQGRLFVMKNLSSGQLYLHCEECESGWNAPEQVGDMAAKFLTLDIEFDAELATWDDIVNAGWEHYAVNLTEQ